VEVLGTASDRLGGARSCFSRVRISIIPAVNR
jgi:hypothetical protein